MLARVPRGGVATGRDAHQGKGDRGTRKPSHALTLASRMMVEEHREGAWIPSHKTVPHPTRELHLCDPGHSVITPTASSSLIQSKLTN